jgi:hypothetical protein
MKGIKEVPRRHTMALLGRIIASHDGDLLVERADLAEGMPGRTPTTWTLITRNAKVDGQIRLPSGFSPRALRGRYVAGISKDSLDVQTVALYSMDRTN